MQYTVPVHIPVQWLEAFLLGCINETCHHTLLGSSCSLLHHFNLCWCYWNLNASTNFPINIWLLQLPAALGSSCPIRVIANCLITMTSQHLWIINTIPLGWTQNLHIRNIMTTTAVNTCIRHRNVPYRTHPDQTRLHILVGSPFLYPSIKSRLQGLRHS